MTEGPIAERFEADVLMDAADDPARLANVMAGEQSSGTLVRLSGETDRLRARSAARLERPEITENRGRRVLARGDRP